MIANNSRSTRNTATNWWHHWHSPYKYLPSSVIEVRLPLILEDGPPVVKWRYFIFPQGGPTPEKTTHRTSEHPRPEAVTQPPSAMASNTSPEKPKQLDNDEEEDYMSMKFDEPAQPSKETSLQRRARLKREVSRPPVSRSTPDVHRRLTPELGRST
jgi:hypothetical protein